MSRDTTEVLVGGVVLLALGLFFVASSGGSNLKTPSGYTLIAGFGQVDGLAVGDEVRLSGVSVGRVESQRLDQHFQAVLTLRIEDDVELPNDSSAAIHTDGLFGSKFVVLEPGGSFDLLQEGDEIQYTQDAVVVGDLLELIISEGKSKRTGAAAPGAPADEGNGQ